MKKDDVLSRSRKRKAQAALQEERLQEAQDLCEQLVRSRPGDIEALLLLATVHRKLGRYPEAEQYCRRALTVDPQLGQSYQILGTALQGQGNLAGAADCYRTALSLDPDLLEARYLLANALRELEDFGQAIAHYEAVLARDPDHVPALCNLGGTLVALHRLDEAAVHLNKANRLLPGAAPVLCQTARVLQLQGRADEAEVRYREALAADPQAVDAMAMLADLLEKSSRQEDAAELVGRGLALVPEHPGLQCCAAKLARREGRYDDAIALAEKALAANPGAAAKGELHMLLGLLYDHQGDSERAFAHFTEGNALLAASCPDGDEGRYLQRLERLRSHFRATSPVLADDPRPHTDEAGKSPVFLVGFPRSGTTLLEQVLDSHPQLQALDERPTVSIMSQAYDAIVARRPAAASALAESEIGSLRKTYFQEAGKYVKREPGRTLVDKQPLNLDSAYLIWRVFPEAKFILALRHPCDVCLSCFMQHFALNDAMETFVNLENTAATYAGVMSLWSEYTAHLPLRYHPIRYEDLVEDMESETRRLLEFLDIEWSPAVMNHVEHAKKRGAINTPSYHQVTQPIYKKAKYRWKRYARELAPILNTLQPFIERFGYAAPSESAPQRREDEPLQR